MKRSQFAAMQSEITILRAFFQTSGWEKLERGGRSSASFENNRSERISFNEDHCRRARCRPESISFLAACFPPVCQGLSRRMHVGRSRRDTRTFASPMRTGEGDGGWRFITSQRKPVLFYRRFFPSNVPIEREHLWPSSLFAGDRTGNCLIYTRYWFLFLGLEKTSIIMLSSRVSMCIIHRWWISVFRINLSILLRCVCSGEIKVSCWWLRDIVREKRDFFLFFQWFVTLKRTKEKKDFAVITRLD